VARGGDEVVRFARVIACDACGGSGAKVGTKPRPCPDCGGSGRKVESRRRHAEGGDIRVQSISTCPKCQGRGTLIDQPCPKCGGRGQVEREETLTVDIPVGVEEGMVLRVPGHGLPAGESNGVPGDLFVVVRTAPDPRFERAGADLWHAETVTIPEATLGTTRRVPTLGTPVDVDIPAGTQPDAVLRVAGKGLPEFGGRAHGDLYVRVRVLVPQRLTPDQRRLYEQLRALEPANARRR
jgi:molecular chaperone DnaJ